MDGTEDDEISRDEGSDSSEDTNNIEIEDNTSDIVNDDEFLAFHDA